MNEKGYTEAWRANLHDFKIDHGIEGATLQGNKSVSNIRKHSAPDVEGAKPAAAVAGTRLKSFITDNTNNQYESAKQPGSPRSSVPSNVPIKREVLIDLSNLNQNA